MCKLLSVIIIVAMVVLYTVSGGNNLIVYAKSITENMIVLSNEKDEQLISICEENLDDFISKLNIQNCNKFFIEDRCIIEGYSSYINNYIVMNNQKINIQISVSDGVCLIGSPVIKNSF